MTDTNCQIHPELKNSSEIYKQNQSKIEKFCAWIVDKIGSPISLGLVILVQAIWITVGQLTNLDPYPYVFMLTVSNIIQLILIFVLALGQRQTNAYNEQRAKTDHESISKLLFEVEKLTKK